jgi:2-polyprenyl-3-methyl-5-hydroxy-6-metoxy-1,4-benzoquinol methylase
MEILQCRVCSDGMADLIGRIPDCGEFAGQLLPSSISGGGLWSCRDCDSMFRYPTRSGSEFLALYEKVVSGAWEDQNDRRKDLAAINAYLEVQPGGSILDIGCYAGDFLTGLPCKFKKYGLEPSISASDRAASKGINILGQTLDDLDSKHVFNVVVSIDVIEHVLDVETFLIEALAHVSRNGLLIISTGNPDSFFWRRVFKAKFWYCSYAEHLAFPSYKYFCKFSKQHNLPLPKQVRLKYVNFRFRDFLFGMFRQMIFATSPVMYHAYIKLSRSLKGNPAPLATDVPLGAPGIFTDHHVIIFRNTN